MELLAPGGDVDSIKAAILAGADAVYCGLDKFNARNRAANINFDDLQGILRLAHQHNCQVFLTLNIIFVDNEIPALIGLLNKLVNTSIDGVIVQDFGLFYLLSRFFKGLKIHASTQLTTHNEGQIRFLSKLNATRVNLSRELNLKEVKALTEVAHQNQMLTEVFVHGSYCVSFSGICYLSSVQGGNSGNRGRCSQPCRDRYVTTPAGEDYPLNLKDNSAWFDLHELDGAGVDSLKIEGRIKKYDYVYTVVSNWRKQLQCLSIHEELLTDNSALYKVFNRDFSNGFLTGTINKDMFIDNPRDHSIQRLSEVNDYTSDHKLEENQTGLYKEKEGIKTSVENKIKQLSIAKIPLVINISGESGSPLEVAVKTPGTSFLVLSEVNLANTGTEVLDYAMIFKRLKAINDTEYFIETLCLDNLKPDVYIPFKELTAIKKRLLFILNDSRETLDPIHVPTFRKQNREKLKSSLLVLISSPNDLHLCKETTGGLCFQLPDSFKNECAEFTDLFRKNENLIPWFPSVIIGDDYIAAVEFLEQVQPKLIVTNNTGIAYEAFQRGSNWIAGPYLNVTNSFSLLSLKENFNCSGAFISNEISQTQMRQLNKPDNFELYYSIYHPIVLMTSRQCLFHQVTGCGKDQIDATCISQCEKSATIINLKNDTIYLEKSKGNYHRIISETNFLNTEIVNDFSDLFSGFLVDLREMKNGNKTDVNKSGIIKQFENMLDGDLNSKAELLQMIQHTTNSQYKRGI
ncbi:related to collagenase [Aquipluma nitroreducens]|uniref:Related to collagenase n=2 Tax=Aquipluma nitroreducens TaxID=2010828 RepID=A0A5K7SDK4_9BACT|nr:related to collagenase [Aquipluma nitroreducens]